MTFSGFYFIALIPIFIGGVLWFCSSRFTWWEWALSSSVALVVAAVCHWSVAEGMVADEEVWSGQVTEIVHRPAWRERYKEAIYRTETYTVRTGKTTSIRTRRVFSHYETRYANHPDTWTARTSIGVSPNIDRSKYEEIAARFGGARGSRRGDRTTMRTGSTMVSGDPSDYFYANKTGHVEPVIRGVAFENRVKASPSVFSFRQLTEDESKRIPDYPAANDTWRSGRAMAPVDAYKWDQMNARVGPSKGVNVIIARLGSASEARNLEAKWVGGKKNDLVLTYGTGWSYVFGWTESAITKRNLESLLLEKPVNDELIASIEGEIRATFKPVDWHKFDYLDLEPRPKHVLILLLAMTITQAAAIFYGMKNEHTK